MITLKYESLEDAVGTNLGQSRWITIDQNRIDAFAEITEDQQWIHVDPERATDSQFGTTIAHGFLTLSLVSAVLEEIFHVENIGMSINYGSDRVRFLSPVPSGARIRGHGEIIDVTPASAGRQVKIRVTMEIEHTERPAAVIDMLIRLMPA